MFELNMIVKKALQDTEYMYIVKNILFSREILRLKSFSHHLDICRYEHVINVSYISYLFAKKIGADYVSLARAGLMHDMFFYDWRNYKNSYRGFKNSHSYIHGKIALKNALMHFKLNDKECEIIEKHMWPITIVPPKYIETYIIGIVDKIIVMYEFNLSKKRQRNLLSIRN